MHAAIALAPFAVAMRCACDDAQPRVIIDTLYILNDIFVTRGECIVLHFNLICCVGFFVSS